MRNLTLKTTLSALLVSVPLAGAFAEDDATRGLPNVDAMYTSSISSAQSSYGRQLDAALTAAQTNLQAGDRSNAVDAGSAAQVRAQIDAVRKAAAQEKAANGDLSAASYQTLLDQVRGIQQTIHGLHNGS
jgi:hypothetical protein